MANKKSERQTSDVRKNQEAGRGVPAGDRDFVERAFDEDALTAESLSPGLLPTGTDNTSAFTPEPELTVGTPPADSDTPAEATIETDPRQPNASFDANPTITRDAAKLNSGGRRVGGPTGGDFAGGGGPAIGETHEADDDGAWKIGSREETLHAFEQGVAAQNTRRLKDEQ
jgi:hypothetical protein